jgi:hypothetical protein
MGRHDGSCAISLADRLPTAPISRRSSIAAAVLVRSNFGPLRQMSRLERTQAPTSRGGACISGIRRKSPLRFKVLRGVAADASTVGTSQAAESGEQRP